MSELPALSSADQKTVHAEIDRRLKANRDRAEFTSLGCLAALLITVELFLPCPPASIALAASALVFGGGRLLGNAAKKRVLQAVAKEVGKEGFLDKLERRASGAPDRMFPARAALGILGPFAIVGSMSMMTVPVVAGILGFSIAGGAAAWWAHRSAQKTAVDVNAFAQQQPSAAVTVAPASQPIPGAPAMLRSRKADFADAASTSQASDTIYPRKQLPSAFKL